MSPNPDRAVVMLSTSEYYLSRRIGESAAGPIYATYGEPYLTLNAIRICVEAGQKKEEAK